MQTNTEDRAAHELDGLKPSSWDAADGMSIDLGEHHRNQFSGSALKNSTALSRRVWIWLWEREFFRRKAQARGCLSRASRRGPFQDVEDKQ